MKFRAKKEHFEKHKERVRDSFQRAIQLSVHKDQEQQKVQASFEAAQERARENRAKAAEGRGKSRLQKHIQRAARRKHTQNDDGVHTGLIGQDRVETDRPRSYKYSRTSSSSVYLAPWEILDRPRVLANGREPQSARRAYILPPRNTGGRYGASTARDLPGTRQSYHFNRIMEASSHDQDPDWQNTDNLRMEHSIRKGGARGEMGNHRFR